ncbi:hypothetical protein Ancab_013670 [Ancistrocladus abbreviatus]
MLYSHKLPTKSGKRRDLLTPKIQPQDTAEFGPVALRSERNDKTLTRGLLILSLFSLPINTSPKNPFEIERERGGSLKITKMMGMAKLAARGAKIVRNERARRAFVTAPTRPLQKSERGKEADEACAKAKEAADTLKEGANHVRRTSEYVKDMASSTAETVTTMTREVKEKVIETADAIKGKLKEPVQGAVSNMWAKTAEQIEDKVAEKIRDRVTDKPEEQGKGLPK